MDKKDYEVYLMTERLYRQCMNLVWISFGTNWQYDTCKPGGHVPPPLFPQHTLWHFCSQLQAMTGWNMHLFLDFF